MRIGIRSTPRGSLADPPAVRALAQAADRLGYAGIWVADARTPAGATLDPLSVLATVAAHTSRVGLGALLVVSPAHQPELLARTLESVGVLSGGRLSVGLEPAGPEGSPSAARLDAVLDVLEAAAGRGVPSRPSVLVGGTSPEDLRRAALRADGWAPAAVPPADLAPRWAWVRDHAARHGRDPDSLRLVVRAEVDVADRAAGRHRAPFHGSLAQVAEDLEVVRRSGAGEVVVGVGGDPCLDEYLDLCARLAEVVARRQ